jgi:hypothetical protein
MIKRRTYDWGDRLNKGDSPSDNPALAQLDGLVAISQASGPSETMNNRVGFYTFRVVSTKPPQGDPSKSKALKGWSNSWIVPARQGLHITQKIAESAREPFKKAIQGALRKDLGL